MDEIQRIVSPTKHHGDIEFSAGIVQQHGPADGFAGSFVTSGAHFIRTGYADTLLEETTPFADHGEHHKTAGLQDLMQLPGGDPSSGGIR